MREGFLILRLQLRVNSDETNSRCGFCLWGECLGALVSLEEVGSLEVGYRGIIKRVSPFVLVGWVGLFLWYGAGLEFFYYAGFVGIFGVMVAEDYWFLTVDDRFILVLGGWVIFFRWLLGDGGEAVVGGVFGSVVGFVLFICSLRKESKIGDSDGGLDFTEEKGGSFLPSLAMGVATWFFLVPKVFVYRYFENVMVVFQMVKGELWVLIGGCAFLIGIFFRVMRVYRERKISRQEEGFGAGDVLVLIVLGMFLGWQGFLVVFFISLVGHIVRFIWDERFSRLRS